MHQQWISIAALASSVAAFPSLDAYESSSLGRRQGYNIGPPPVNNYTAPNGYIAPGPNDVRSPCPALKYEPSQVPSGPPILIQNSTLANHGFLPRNGQGINRTLIQQAFVDGFNVGFSVTETPKENAFNVCEYITGEYCYTMDLNILNTPHTFEHDHSLSRQDYMEGYSPSAPVDNHTFNTTIFQTTLAVLQGSLHMTFGQANEVRLQRESLASVSDKPGWFTLAQDTQETELGFVYSIMKDFNLPNYLTNPLARVDWWDFWFSYESFPTPLGWAPPTVQVEETFVSSVSSAIRTNQVITSTPTPFASSFLRREPAIPTGGPVSAINPASPTPVPGVPSSAAPSRISSAQSAAGPRPFAVNPYATSLAPTQWKSLASAIESNVAAVQSQLATTR